MTRLREALGDIAEEAPLVSLADVAIAGHRHRRRTVLTASAVAVLCVTAAAVAVVAAVPWPRGARTATQQGQEAVPDLPSGKVGAISRAYMTSCKVVEREADCAAVEWRVITRAGKTYRVPQALAETAKDERVPVAISRDGRLLAYYSRDAQAHVVRDLVGGTETTSPVTIKEERIGMGSMLVLSDDGRYIAFDPREGSKYPGMLIDVRTGRTTPVNGKYEPVSVKGGVAELVRYRKTDLWLMPVTGGGKPVRFNGVFIMFSEVAPDGRTVVAFEFPRVGKRESPRLEKSTLTLLDAKTGKTLRKVPISGLPDDRGGVAGTTIWQSESEVTLLYGGKEGERSYAVDVNTGRVRLLDRQSGRPMNLTYPGAAASG
ncbi:hypothetical protein [Nonomuraea aurantiaca]|uniref:hypothetical protein n=1 Tax=Nonomuraea aurantiaca TaxID=2878562 RepID=UPI001CD924C1|nr:hypothetical protein [Nonomuraea aurantiaca]MCA2220165.1 hypothetical protein [Nonomuraea aurantiaca]